MKFFVVLFGILIVAAALVMLVRPASFVEFMRRYSYTASMHILAVGVRAMLGVVLLLYADQSKFPVVLRVIGWLSLIAALVFAAIPRTRFTALIHWVLDRFAGYARAGALAAMLFGVFLVYAVL